MTCLGSQLVEALLRFFSRPCPSWDRGPHLSLWPQPQLLYPGPSHRSTSPWCLERSQPALGPWVAPTGLHSKLHIVKGPRYMVPFVNCDVNHRCSALSWNAFWGVRVEVRGCPVVAKTKAL